MAMSRKNATLVAAPADTAGYGAAGNRRAGGWTPPSPPLRFGTSPLKRGKDNGDNILFCLAFFLPLFRGGGQVGVNGARCPPSSAAFANDRLRMRLAAPACCRMLTGVSITPICRDRNEPCRPLRDLSRLHTEPDGSFRVSLPGAPAVAPPDDDWRERLCHGIGSGRDILHHCRGPSGRGAARM